MKLYIDVPYNGIIHSFLLLNNTDRCRLEIAHVFIIDVFKEHNYLYKFKAFFYNSKNIYTFREYKTKTLLHSAIQKLLQEELSDV